MKDTLKKVQHQYLDEFDHHYACWAANHNGWRKAKRANHRIALAKDRRIAKSEINKSLYNI